MTKKNIPVSDDDTVITHLLLGWKSVILVHNLNVMMGNVP